MPMKVLISADMEGATGVTWPEDVRPGAPQWERCRHLFTGDVNAVVTGYLDAGAEDVLVNEAHSTMRNLLLEELDPRGRLLVGRHKPLGMMQGVQDGIDLGRLRRLPRRRRRGRHPQPYRPGRGNHRGVAQRAAGQRGPYERGARQRVRRQGRAGDRRRPG